MELPRLKRVRWAVRMTLILGVAASIVANILHARDNPISQAIAAWPPLALLLTVELISRVPVHRRSLAAARVIATATIAGIAAWVSYWHMVGVAAKYGEEGAAPYLLPLSVDGLIVVASICLVELGSRITEALAKADAAAAPAPAATAERAATPDTAEAPAPPPTMLTGGPIVLHETELHPTRTPVATASRTSAAPGPYPAAAAAAAAPGTDAIRTPVPDTARATAQRDPDTARTPVPDTASSAEASGADAAQASEASDPDTAPAGGPSQPDAGDRAPTPTRVPVSEPPADARTNGTRPASGRPDIRRAPATQGGTEPPPRPRPRTPSVPVAAAGRPSGGARTSGSLAHALDPAPTAAGSKREQVFLLLDQHWSVNQVRELRPTKVADELLPRLDDADRDTVARYVRQWCEAIDSGARVPAGQLRSVPRR